MKDGKPLGMGAPRYDVLKKDIAVGNENRFASQGNMVKVRDIGIVISADKKRSDLIGGAEIFEFFHRRLSLFAPVFKLSFQGIPIKDESWGIFEKRIDLTRTMNKTASMPKMYIRNDAYGFFHGSLSLVYEWICQAFCFPHFRITGIWKATPK